MANTITAFLETLVAASGDFNKAKVGRLSFLDNVYLDVKPEAARMGQTIDVYFPDMTAWTEQGTSDWTTTDINPNFVPVVFNSRPGKGILIRSFEQFLTSVDIIKNFYDPMYKRGLEYMNGVVAGMVTTGNFNTYAPIAGLAPGTVKRADVTNGWNQLAGNKVPVDDTENLGLLTHNDVHSQMLNDNDWTQESIVSAALAQAAREKADLGVAFNFKKSWDQQSPKTSTALVGTIAITNGSANIVGSGTAFTTALTVGCTVYFGSDGTYTPYRILSIADDTHAALTANYGGVTAAASSGKKVAYTSLMLHKYAMALAVRPLQLVNDGTVQSRIVMLKGIPFRVMLSYQHRNDGYLLTMDVGCGSAVLRPDFGILIQS